MNKVEVKVQNLCMKVLKKNTIELDDNIFVIGCDSINTLIFTSAINKTFSISLMITDVIDHPTIREIAALVINKSDKKNYKEGKDSFVIFLDEYKKSLPNVFFIHDVTGEINIFSSLRNLLKSKYNCIGIRSYNKKALNPKLLNLEDYCKKIVDEIQLVQNGGNEIYILGWSNGGVYAYEVVRQLELLIANEVKLIVFDTPALKYPQDDIFTLESETLLISKYLDNNKLDKHIENSKQLWQNILKLIKTGLLSINEILCDEKLELLIKMIPNFHNLSLVNKIKTLSQIRSLINSALYYHPKNIITSAFIFFKAENSVLDYLPWDKCCRGKLKVFDVPGDHFTMLNEKNVKYIFDCYFRHNKEKQA